MKYHMHVFSDLSERLSYDDAFPLCTSHAFLSEYPHKAALCHWHEDVEFLIPLRGHMTYRVNGKEYLLDETCGIFVNARQLHYGYSTDDTDCEFLCIIFNPKLLCSSDRVRNQYIFPVIHHTGIPCRLLHTSQAKEAAILNIMKEIQYTENEKAPGYELSVSGKIHTLWGCLYELIKEEADNLLSAEENIMIQKNMLSYVHIHFKERISLEDIAHSGGVSRSTCCRLFKTYMGRSPIDYLISYRLEQSCAMLKGSQTSITEIAYACGFSNPSYFTESFFRFKGCTPTKYRKALTPSDH